VAMGSGGSWRIDYSFSFIVAIGGITIGAGITMSGIVGAVVIGSEKNSS